jgi:hypothetical protein
VFVGLGSFDAIADMVGPLLRKDVGLFAGEAAGTDAPSEALLAAADRFLDLVAHPR